ncbi:hypothetical protein [Halocynthiibacter namhaensis]|uniref:hypothetical protein n=1 Tax=Halocynthiibacter namhaensis TaxID=1290553 RepID=UPI00057902C9|nr:hypothetical protein [Halocynthiibacter namhaensis]
MLSRISILTVAAVFAATFVSAQPIITADLFPKPQQVLLADLTGDGVDDKLQIYALNERFDVLSFAVSYGGRFRDNEAVILPINLSDLDSLERLPNGNIAIHWGCFACGRTHSHHSITIRYHNLQLQVIGYDFTSVDRIFAAAFSCSVNFLNGRAVIKAIEVDSREVPASAVPVSLAQFDFRRQPIACDALDQYDDVFLEKHFPRPED